jgi:hypothetical protein
VNVSPKTLAYLSLRGHRTKTHPDPFHTIAHPWKQVLIPDGVRGYFPSTRYIGQWLPPPVPCQRSLTLGTPVHAR